MIRRVGLAVGLFALITLLVVVVSIATDRKPSPSTQAQPTPYATPYEMSTYEQLRMMQQAGVKLGLP